MLMTFFCEISPFLTESNNFILYDVFSHSVFVLYDVFLIELNLSLYSLYYAKACSEFAGPISMSLRLWATQLLSKKIRSYGEPLATLCPI